MSSGISAFNEGYVKTVWTKGDVITAAKLNNIEEGIENAEAFIVESTIDTNVETLSKTWKDIYEALSSGKVCFIKLTPEGDNDATVALALSVYLDLSGDPDPLYTVYATYPDGYTSYTTTDEDGYPSYTHT